MPDQKTCFRRLEAGADTVCIRQSEDHATREHDATLKTVRNRSFPYLLLFLLSFRCAGGCCLGFSGCVPRRPLSLLCTKTVCHNLHYLAKAHFDNCQDIPQADGLPILSARESADESSTVEVCDRDDAGY